MKKILFSVLTIGVASVLAVGVTSAVFTSQATVEDNTFSTGVLEIRVNGQSSIEGFDFENAAPGECVAGQFDVNNYGQPWFNGPSTLTAKRLLLSSMHNNGDPDLYNVLKIKVERCAGPCEDAYYGKLKDLTNKNILLSWYSDGLIAGNSETIKYEVCLPDWVDNIYQGKSTTFDFIVDGFNP